jgi:hypothetical protein
MASGSKRFLGIADVRKTINSRVIPILRSWIGNQRYSGLLNEFETAWVEGRKYSAPRPRQRRSRPQVQPLPSHRAAGRAIRRFSTMGALESAQPQASVRRFTAAEDLTGAADDEDQLQKIPLDAALAGGAPDH